ncbi:response regulator transcription factor [Ferdinandcohnia sp. Marseille-Q9671]
MTVKMLIVDDEPIISQGLRLTIPWDEYGIEVIGEAGSGKEASEILSNQQVDIVLTDVRMPEMDGIQLARFIHDSMPHVHVIIISGYDEFDYAQKAIRYQVKDYLLKPVDIDELVEKVQQLKNEILLEKHQEANVEKEKKREIVSQLILNPQLQLPNATPDLFEEERYCVVVSEIPDYATVSEELTSTELEEFRKTWSDSISSVCLDSISFFAHVNLLVAVVFSVDHEEIRNGLEQLELQLRFGVSDVFKNPLQVYEAHRQAVDAIFTKELSTEKVLLYKQTQEPLKKVDYMHLYETLFTHDYEKLTQLVDELFTNMSQEKYDLNEMRVVCHELNETIETKLKGLLTETAFADVSYRVTIELDLHFYNTSNWLKKLLLSDLDMWLGILEKENQGKKSWSVEKAIEYISENYHRDLKASEVANEIHITPNYFSMIFKKELGKSFNEYLNDLRIEKAMRMLTETSDRIYEIATEVGYKEYKYFVQVFRKKTGMTPTDYRTYKGINKS